MAGVDLVCESVVDAVRVDGAAVAVLTATHRVRDLIYATDAIAERLDELQFILGEGPCLNAVIRDGAHLWADLDESGPGDERWPAFTAEALDAGARALFAFPVPGVQRPLGAFELYRRTAGPLTAEETECAAMMAQSLSTLLMSNWRRYQSTADPGVDPTVLAAADGVSGPHPFSRAAVHVAAGMIAVQLGVTPREGIDRLRAHCYANRRSLHSVAADVIGHRLVFDE